MCKKKFLAVLLQRSKKAHTINDVCRKANSQDKQGGTICAELFIKHPINKKYTLENGLLSILKFKKYRLKQTSNGKRGSLTISVLQNPLY